MLIYEAKVNGKVVGRCDAGCHEATGSECNCICGGAFHGVGTRIAIEDRNTLTDEELLEDARARGNSDELKVIRPPLQGELFSCRQHPKP